MRVRIDKVALALTRSFLLKPDQYWGPDGIRHVKKLTRGLGRSAGEAERTSEVVDEVLAIARLRVSHAPAPLYLSNAGNSGSRWLEAMLWYAAGVHRCGEVYLPRTLVQQLKLLPPADASFFLNAVYVAHSDNLGPHLVSGHCVNSAHVAKVSELANLTPGAKKVLLLRQPADIALSRTLGKPAHRAEVAPSMDDRAYLEHNCQMVERFHAALATESFDATVRYEDLVARPVEALTFLLDALGIRTSSEAIRFAVAATSRGPVEHSAAHGGNVKTNLYRDEVRASKSLQRRALARMLPLSLRLGYQATDAST